MKNELEEEGLITEGSSGSQLSFTITNNRGHQHIERKGLSCLAILKVLINDQLTLLLLEAEMVDEIVKEDAHLVIRQETE